MSKSQIFVLTVFLAGIAVFFLLDLDRFLDFQFIKSQHNRIQAYFKDYPIWTASLFMLAYILVTSLSLPGAGIMTLFGGAAFGLWWGTLLVIVAATIGATVAFLAARFLFHDQIQSRFRHRLHAINAGIDKDGIFYLFIVRMIPVFPYFLVNLLMGLTTIRLSGYILATFFGMIPVTLIVVNAGSQLTRIESLGGILSPSVILSLCLLAMLPLAGRFMLRFIKNRNRTAI